MSRLITGLIVVICAACVLAAVLFTVAGGNSGLGLPDGGTIGGNSESQYGPVAVIIGSVVAGVFGAIILLLFVAFLRGGRKRDAAPEIDASHGATGMLRPTLHHPEDERLAPPAGREGRYRGQRKGE